MEKNYRKRPRNSSSSYCVSTRSKSNGAKYCAATVSKDKKDSANKNESEDSNPEQILWPAKDPCKKKFPSNGLLDNLDDALWLALAHVDPQEFNTRKGKQLPIRKGLNLINMGWVATNTTPYRVAVGEKFDEAKRLFERNGWRSPLPLPDIADIKVEIMKQKWPSCMKNQVNTIIENGIQYSNKNGELEFNITCNNCKDLSTCKCKFPSQVANQILKSLELSGLAVIRGAVDSKTANSLIGRGQNGSVSHATKIITSSKIHKLMHTSANGMGGDGGSHYSSIEASKYLDHLQQVVVRSLLDDDNSETDATLIASSRKCILLKYSEGAENWAHRDGVYDKIFPYQAVVLLSCSDEFDGGNFYVAKRMRTDVNNAVGKCVQTHVELNQGDMIIFRADGDGGFDHGMMRVERGERIAAGLLQPK